MNMKGNYRPAWRRDLPVNFSISARRVRLLGLFIMFLSLPVLAFPEIIFGQQTLYKTDLTWIHFPRHLFAATEWLAGRVPLWDPYEDTGIPLLAESQVGVLYPLSALFLTPLSPSFELSLYILIHFSLAAFFTFVLARSLGLGWAAATLAGLAFGLGGFLMAQTPNLNIMTGAVWLPLILYGVLQAIRRRSWLVALLAGLPLALQILTAQPQVVFYSLVTLAGYALYRVSLDFFSGDHRRQPGYAGQTLLLLALVVLSGLLLAAPQLIPTYELQQLSVRAQERGVDFLTENSLPPLMWLNLLLPSAFGNNVTGFSGGDPFQEDFIYLGFIPLVLSFFGIAALWRERTGPHWRERLFFLLLFIAAAMLAMGRFTPLYQLLIQYLPGFALFRIPARWLMVVNLALAILAGLGLEAMLAKGLTRRSYGLLLLAGLVLITGVSLSWIFRAELLGWSEQLSGVSPKLVTAFLDKSFSLQPVYEGRWLALLRVPALLLAFNFILAVTLFSLLAARRLTHPTFAGLVILATALDLVLAGGTTINPTKPADWWWQLSGGAGYVLNNLEAGRVFPLGMGSEALTVSHLGQYFPSVYQLHSAGGHASSLRLERHETFLKETNPVQALQVVGVRYLLAEGYIGADAAAAYPIVYADEQSIVHENKAPLPRAFVAHQVVQAEQPAEALAHFQNRQLDPRQTVVIESTGPLPQPDPATGSGDVVAISRQHPQVVEIRASLSSAGYLVLLDSFYPGWVATIDDQPGPVYRANYIGRAVFVPAGDHLVRFEYRPGSFRVGLGLALLAALLIAAMAAGRYWVTQRGQVRADAIAD